MPNYTVKQGDCISSIAESHGLFWEKVWNHPKNARLKEQRKDPNILYSGDVIFIPDKEKKEESGPTEQRHRFKKKGTPAKLRMMVEQDDIPIADTPFILEVDGKLYQGKTDKKGFLEVSIDPKAKRGRLRVGDLEMELELGGMDPLDENIGVQERLQNLGFYEGELDGTMSPETKEAIASFQHATGLKETGELDDATRQKLFSWQDKEHEITNPPEADQTEESQEESEPPADDEDTKQGKSLELK
jgi:N-acetylmuramoyl-L-alanine amidase